MKSTQYNYYNVINKRPKYCGFFIITTMSLMIIITFILQLEVYSKRVIYAIAKDNLLYADIIIDNTDTINKGDYLRIDRQLYKYKITNISDLMVNESNYLNYQQYELYIGGVFKDNEVIKLTIYYNKQRIIHKIWQLLF